MRVAVLNPYTYQVLLIADFGSILSFQKPETEIFFNVKTHLFEWMDIYGENRLSKCIPFDIVEGFTFPFELRGLKKLKNWIKTIWRKKENGKA
jgi:hypothetical protein